jgi:hypothetical protein
MAMPIGVLTMAAVRGGPAKGWRSAEMTMPTAATAAKALTAPIAEPVGRSCQLWRMDGQLEGGSHGEAYEGAHDRSEGGHVGRRVGVRGDSARNSACGGA